MLELAAEFATKVKMFDFRVIHDIAGDAFRNSVKPHIAVFPAVSRGKIKYQRSITVWATYVPAERVGLSKCSLLGGDNPMPALKFFRQFVKMGDGHSFST